MKQRIWVRSLAARHRPRVLDHLLALPGRDRHRRFAAAVSDAQLRRYADQIDFEGDEVLGVFDHRGEVIAMAHLAYLGSGRGRAAELGVSVDTHWRGHGIGSRLCQHTVLHARNRGAATLLIHTARDNTPMLRIARSAGATVEVHGGDCVASVTLAPRDLWSRVQQSVARAAAEIDHGLQFGMRRFAGVSPFAAGFRFNQQRDRFSSPPPSTQPTQEPPCNARNMQNAPV